MKKVFKHKRLNMAQQILKLRKDWNSGEVISYSHKGFEWYCKLRPTYLSREYELTVIYKVNGLPKAYIRRDNLLKNTNDKLPHIYKCEDSKVELCLYYGNEFNSALYISDTIVPWAVEWLFYYEVWLRTGEWQGGGIHPVVPK